MLYLYTFTRGMLNCQIILFFFCMDKFQKWPQRQIAIYAFIVSNKGLSYICKPVMVKKKGEEKKSEPRQI